MESAATTTTIISNSGGGILLLLVVLLLLIPFTTLLLYPAMLQCYNHHEDKSTTTSNDNNNKPGGLANPSNNCFANSIVQALAGFDSFINFIQQDKTIDHKTGPPNSSGGGSSIWQKLIPLIPPSCGDNITHTLGAIIARINQSYPTSCSGLIQSVSKSKSCWLFPQQQDAQEFYQLLMDAVDCEAKLTQDEEILQSQGLDSVNRPMTKSIQDIAFVCSKLKNPFLGSMINATTCQECGSSQGYVENFFTSISIPLSDSVPKNTISLQECLTSLTATEQVSNVDCQRCSLIVAKNHLKRIIDTSKCKSSQQLYRVVQTRIQEIEAALSYKVITDDDFTKLKPPQIKKTVKDKICRFGGLPDGLAIHISRSQFNPMTGQPTKNRAHLEFPQMLDMAPYTLDLQQQPSKSPSSSSIYKLESLIIHYGTHNYGHYIAYRRQHTQWFRISDMDVRPVSESHVLEADNVFMLFYQRCPPPPPPPSSPTATTTTTIQNDSCNVEKTSNLSPQPLVVAAH